MRLTISIDTEPIVIYGNLEPSCDLSPARQVFLDGKRVPPSLEQIILIGLDRLTDDYVSEELMRRLKDGE